MVGTKNGGSRKRCVRRLQLGRSFRGLFIGGFERQNGRGVGGAGKVHDVPEGVEEGQKEKFYGWGSVVSCAS